MTTTIARKMRKEMEVKLIILSVGEVYGESKLQGTRIEGIVREREVIFGEPSLVDMTVEDIESDFVERSCRISSRLGYGKS